MSFWMSVKINGFAAGQVVHETDAKAITVDTALSFQRITMVLFAHFLIERITIVERQINVDWIAVPIYIRDGAFRIQITCFWTIRIVQRIFIFGVFTIQYAFYCIKVAGPIFPGHNQRNIYIPTRTIRHLAVRSFRPFRYHRRFWRKLCMPDRSFRLYNNNTLNHH